MRFGFGWPHGPVRCAENGPWDTCIDLVVKWGNLTGVKQYWLIYMYIWTWMAAHNIATFFGFGWPRDQALRMDRYTRVYVLQYSEHSE